MRPAVAIRYLLDLTAASLPRKADDGTTILTYLTDPGHGWLVVPRALLADILGPFGGLGLISEYSYLVRTDSGPVYWLEEDCDAGICLALWKRQSDGFGRYAIREHAFEEPDPRGRLPRAPKRSTADDARADAILDAEYRARTA